MKEREFKRELCGGGCLRKNGQTKRLKRNMKEILKSIRMNQQQLYVMIVTEL